jgi:thiol-disulfide isomerase/thioredoxin
MNFNTIINKASDNILLCVAVLALLIGIIIACYVFMYKPYMKKHEGLQTEQTKNAEIMLFTVDWCPHCKTAKPIWNDLKQEYNNTLVNGYTVTFTEINCTEPTTSEVEALLDKYKIEGYPSIKLIKDNQIIEYDAKPSRETLIQFLDTSL